MIMRRTYFLAFALACFLLIPIHTFGSDGFDEIQAEIVRLHGEGKYGEAIRYATQRLVKVRKQFGPNSRQYANYLFTLGGLNAFAGKDTEARKYFNRAAGIQKRNKFHGQPLGIGTDGFFLMIERAKAKSIKSTRGDGGSGAVARPSGRASVPGTPPAMLVSGNDALPDGRATAPRDSVAQELMQMERDWSEAYLKHDTATIERILADDYVGTDGRGIMTTKADEIEEAKPLKPGDPLPPFAVLDESVTDMKVRIYGNVAVVNGRVIEKVRTPEKESEIQYRRTTVWVKRQGRWQCVSFHGSRILEPPKQ
jgi:hypothetical protein